MCCFAIVVDSLPSGGKKKRKKEIRKKKKEINLPLLQSTTRKNQILGL